MSKPRTPAESEVYWRGYKAGQSAEKRRVSRLAASAPDEGPVAEVLSRVDTDTAEGRAFIEGYGFARKTGPRYGGFMPFGDERTPGEPAARPAVPALDVERLAKAIWLVQHNTAEDHYDRNVPPRSPHRAEVDEVGEQVAAEYEALTQREGERAYERGEDHP